VNAGAIFVTIDADYSNLGRSINAARDIVEKGGARLGKAMAKALGGDFRKDVQDQLFETGKSIVRSQEVVGRAAGSAFARAFASETQNLLGGAGGAGAGGGIVKYVAPPPGAMVMVGRSAARDIADGLELEDVPLRSSSVSMGKKIGTETSKGLFQTFTQGINEQAKGAVMAVLGISMADRLLRGIADTIRGDKTIGQALYDVVTSVPIAGAAVELGEAIGAAAVRGMESLRDPNRDARRQADIAFEAAMKEENARNTAREQRQQAETSYNAARRNEETRHLQSLRDDLVNRETERAKLAAKNRGDELAFLEIEYAQALEKLQAEERQALGPLTSKGAADAANAILAERRKLLEDEFAERRMMIEKEIADEQAMKQRELDKLEQARIASVKKENELRRRQQEELAKFDEESLATRIEAQRAGVGSVSTFAGEFKFDAYSDAAKKKNDDTMVKELKTIREKISLGGFA